MGEEESFKCFQYLSVVGCPVENIAEIAVVTFVDVKQYDLFIVVRDDGYMASFSLGFYLFS